ncbi:pseudouridine synthase [Sphingomonas desiccabilis]|uniref:pseudouridine synthase n=1 Tax=Sphingomonas desiccabilis TaxID=429134 RepID=UPI0017AF299E|nr:pseudouridine synthase [Sphingomonas desiccabilis]MBB3910354.1 23S rRNA pseudouridine2605 synthase [Sphingomonas desiccabilis]
MSTSKTQEPQRIAKLLARAGVASRRDVERLIEARRVALDGVPIETPATLLTSLRGITVDGEPVQAAAPTRLFRYHKPAGVLTAARDPHGRQTIYDRMPGDLPRLMPVGRLDLNTEGLLLLTTDGELKRQLELPATGVERTYRARAYGEVSQAQLEELMLGVEIEGVRYGPINANMERRTGTNVWIEMTLTEGKNREVRRVLEYLGLQVSRLIRTRYGPFYLEDMPIASVDEIRQHDLVAFRKTLKDRPTSKPAPEGADPAALKQWRREPSRDRTAPRPRPSPVSYGERVAREVQPHPQAFRRNRPTPEDTGEAPRGSGFGKRAAERGPRRKDSLAGRRDDAGAPRSPRGQRAAAFADRTGRKPAAERGERPVEAGRGDKPRSTLSAAFGGERPARDDRRPPRTDRAERPQRGERPQRADGPRSAFGKPRSGEFGAGAPRGEAGRGPRGEGPRTPRPDGPRPPRGDGPRGPRRDEPRTPRGDAPRAPRGDGPARPPRGGRPGSPPKGRR